MLAGRAEEWMDYFPSLPPDPSLTGAIAQPNLDWESSLNTADSFLDVDWTNTEIKRRRSAPAVQDSSKSYLPAASDALVPDWNQDPKDSGGKINGSTRGRSLPEVRPASSSPNPRLVLLVGHPALNLFAFNNRMMLSKQAGRGRHQA